MRQRPRRPGSDDVVAGLGAPPVPRPITGKAKAGTPRGNPPEIPAFVVERETGFGPATLSLGKRRAGLAPARTEPQTLVTTAPGYHGLPHWAYGTASDFPKFATTPVTTPRTLDIRAGILLTARDVAERLRVSTATVYALCRRGELGHHRVSNAIRVAEDALVGYLRLAGRSTASKATPRQGA